MEKAPAQLIDAVRALDAAAKIEQPEARADALAAADQALHQACEALPQDDPRKAFGATLEGLAHFAEGRSRSANAAAWSSFDAARVSFESVLAKKSNDLTPELSGEAAWKSVFAASGPVEYDSLSPLAQSALLAKFRHAVALYWCARTAPDDTKRQASAKAAADEFAALHEELGRSVEGSASLLAQALSEEFADSETGAHKAINSLQVLVARPLAGATGAARSELDGIRQAALIALVRLNALDKTASHPALKSVECSQRFRIAIPAR